MATAAARTNWKGEYLLGLDVDSPFRCSFRKHAHHAYSVATGLGKSTTVRCVVCQLLAQDTRNRVVVLDTKQVSMAGLIGLPNLVVYNDPDQVGLMVAALAFVKQLVKDRYAYLKAHPGYKFPLELVVLEEGNDFSRVVLDWHRAQPGVTAKAVWPGWQDLVAYILEQGREVNVHMLAVFQDFDDRQFGGVSLRGLFDLLVIAGWNPNQWKKLAGEKAKFVEPGHKEGRMLVLDGQRQTWVQAVNADPAELRQYVEQSHAAIRARWAFQKQPSLAG